MLVGFAKANVIIDKRFPSRYMSLPLIQQGEPAPLYLLTPALNCLAANSWIGYAFCYIVIMVIYYTNTWSVSPNLKLPRCIPILNFISM